MDMQREAELTNIAYALVASQPASMRGVVSELADRDDAASLLMMAATVGIHFPEYAVSVEEGFDILTVLLKEEHITLDDFTGPCKSIFECTSPFGACRCLPYAEMNL